MLAALLFFRMFTLFAIRMTRCISYKCAGNKRNISVPLLLFCSYALVPLCSYGLAPMPEALGAGFAAELFAGPWRDGAARPITATFRSFAGTRCR